MNLSVRLSDWLRNKKGLYSVDTFDDNMCLFRCIAQFPDGNAKHSARSYVRTAKSVMQT